MISIDLESAIPLEDQLRKALRTAIARGEVKPGEALPSVRQLAADLDIHWNTVARAYRRLGDEGLLSVRRGRGAIVKNIAPSLNRRIPKRVQSIVGEKIVEAITEARLAGISLEVFREMTLGKLEQWEDAGDERVG